MNQKQGLEMPHKCPTCGAIIQTPAEFRNRISWREYHISGMCQKCQDAVFGED